MMKEAVILAGGLGTRLRKVVPDLPKVMAPVGGKPFLFHILNWLMDNKIDKVVISAGYRSGSIINYVSGAFGTKSIDYAVEDKPLGTGGAVLFALKKTTGAEVLLINGDTWFPVDLGKFYSFHENAGSLFSIALKEMKNFDRYGTVDFSGSTILGFNEKRYCEKGVINGGIYLLNRHFIESKHYPEIFSLEKDFLEKEAASGILKGMIFDDPFIDIGIPEDYLVAQDIIKPGRSKDMQ